MATKDEDEDLYAKQAEHVTGRRAARFTAMLRAQEAASRDPELQLSEAAQRSVAEFRREADELQDLVEAEGEVLLPFPGPRPDLPVFAATSPLRVFGPPYELGWVHLDQGQANADTGAGRLRASNFTIGPARFTVAQLGVRFRPTFRECRLSVRPYTRFSGFDILKHRVHQPDSSEQRWAWASGSVGVKVDSVNASGGNYNLDAETWVEQWDRAALNPQDSREYDGTVGVPDGLALTALANRDRVYSVWVTCLVGVSADPGFEVSTSATSSIAVDVPFFVVEEIDGVV